MVKFVFAGLAFFLAANLFSCGQKGPLYLPDEMPGNIPEAQTVQTDSEIAAEQAGAEQSPEDQAAESVAVKKAAAEQKKKTNH